MKKNYILILIFLVSPLQMQADAEKYHKGKQYFNEKKYAKALPLLLEEAKNGSQPSMYRLAYMYENGLGTKRDYKQSTYWYKKMSSAYKYTINLPSEQREDKKTFYMRISDQIKPETNKEGAAFALSKIDTKTPASKTLINSYFSGDFFGLLPYQTNYFLPVSYANSKYLRHAPGIHPNASLTPLEKKYEYYNRTEVEFQISLKKQLTYNLLGWHEFLNVAYTQTVWWQLYSVSSPFRENNYKPEVFMAIPSSEYLDHKYGLKGVKLGYLHESNGQEGYRSRSWNRLYMTALWQWNDLFLSSRVWYRIPEKKKSDNYYNGNGLEADGSPTDPNQSGDDNPNIQNYIGYGDIHINYLYKKHQIGALLRYNFDAGGKNRGAVELNWSYPFLNSSNTFWYVKIFSGYGESLIDYDRSVTKASFGFSFSRDLF